MQNDSIETFKENTSINTIVPAELIEPTQTKMSRRGFMISAGLATAALFSGIRPTTVRAQEETNENSYEIFVNEKADDIDNAAKSAYYKITNAFDDISTYEYMSIKEDYSPTNLHWLYKNVLYYAGNISALNTDCENPYDYRAHFGQTINNFAENNTYANQFPIYDDEAMGLTHHLERDEPIIRNLVSIIFKNQPVRGAHVVFINSELAPDNHYALQTDSIMELNVQNPPYSETKKAWIHEMMHTALPWVKRIFRDPWGDNTGEKFITAGHAYPKVAQYYTHVMNDLASDTNFINERFFSKPGDGLFRAADEWMAMLLADALTEDLDKVFNNYSGKIQQLILDSLNLAINGNEADAHVFTKEDLTKLREEIGYKSLLPLINNSDNGATPTQNQEN